MGPSYNDQQWLFVYTGLVSAVMVQADGGEAVDLGEILMAAPLQGPLSSTKVGGINISMMKKLLQVIGNLG